MKITSVYLDVLYEAQPDCKTIDVSIEQHSQRFAVLHGGLRMISMILPEEFVGRDLDVSVKSDGQLAIGSVTSRSITHGPLGIQHDPRGIEECLQNASPAPVSLQWFATWKCNYKCNYCWQETTRDSYRKVRNADVTPDEWIEAFSRIPVQEFYISGGEPTVLPGMLDIVNGIGQRVPIKMTSNLGKSFDVDQWIKEVDPNNLDCVTFSFHPTQQSWEEYSSKITRFADAFGGHKTGCELVMHPDQRHFEQGIRDIQKELDLRTINIDVYHVQPAKFPPNPGEGTDRCPHQDTSLTMAPRATDKTDPVYCSAGVNRVNVDPLGDVYTCMSAIDRGKMFGQEALPHYRSIGNVFEGFSMSREPTLCWEKFRCSACDASIVQDSWTPHPHPYELPLPE